jgi:transposase-like protein
MRVRKGCSTPTKIPQVQRRLCHTSLRDFAREYRDRRAAMAAAYASGTYTMKAIAAYFGGHYSTVSRAVKDAERQRLDAPTPRRSGGCWLMRVQCVRLRSAPTALPQAIAYLFLSPTEGRETMSMLCQRSLWDSLNGAGGC